MYSHQHLRDRLLQEYEHVAHNKRLGQAGQDDVDRVHEITPQIDAVDDSVREAAEAYALDLLRQDLGGYLPLIDDTIDDPYDPNAAPAGWRSKCVARTWRLTDYSL